MKALPFSHCCSETTKSLRIQSLFVCVCRLRYPTCNAHAQYCRLWTLRLYDIFL